MANDIIDINVYETVETVDITVEPNLTTININSVTGGGAVTSVNGQTGEVVIATSDNNFTTALKTKLDGIASGAEVNVNADWNATSGDAQILNKPTIPDITNLVPYTGATNDVNLSEFGVQLGNIEFDLTPTNVPTTVGSLVWNDLAGTLDLKLKGGAVTLQIGQETVARVVNKTATNITLQEANYQAVRVTGAQGQRPKVDLAQANNDLNSTTTLGLVTENILNNQEGFITTSGQVQQVNTTGSLQGETWVDGDILYLSGTVAGRITNIKPIAPIHTVIIGFVEYAHINQGKIFVKVDNGYELDELHNVSAATPNNNEALVYDTPTLLWKPKALTTADIADSTNKRYQTENQKLYNDATSSIQTQLNSKQATLSGTGLVKSTAGVISYDTNKYVKNIVKDAVQKTVTGTTVTTIISSYLIPENTLVAGDTLKIDPSMFSRSGTGGMVIAIYINSSISISGALKIAQSNTITSTQLFTLFTRHFIVDGTNIKGYPIGSSTVETSPSTSAIGSSLYDLTQDKYIIFTVTPTIALDVTIQEGINITN